MLEKSEGLKAAKKVDELIDRYIAAGSTDYISEEVPVRAVGKWELRWLWLKDWWDYTICKIDIESAVFTIIGGIIYLVLLGAMALIIVWG